MTTTKEIIEATDKAVFTGNFNKETFNKEWVSKTEIKKKLNNLLEFEYPDIITEIEEFIEVLEWVNKHTRGQNENNKRNTY